MRERVDLGPVAILADDTPKARAAVQELARRYETVDDEAARALVAVGGDGFMLRVLRANLGRHVDGQPIGVYGLNAGTVGFFMNTWDPEGLAGRLAAAEATTVTPLRLVATLGDSGEQVEAVAVNDVAVTRASPQAARLSVSVSGVPRVPELVGDGVLVATPVGSTGYNRSARGPVIPLGAELMALTPICPARPRRWPGALLPAEATVAIDNLDPAKRPVSVSADSLAFDDVRHVEVTWDRHAAMRLLFDPGHALDERLLAEMFDL